MIKRKYKKKKVQIQEPYYVVVNKHGEVFAGILGGYPNWSTNWDEAKPLHYSNTKYLRQENTNVELILETEFK